MSELNVSFKIENKNNTTVITPKIDNPPEMDTPSSRIIPYLGRSSSGDFYDVGLAIQNPGDSAPTISVMKKIPLNKIGSQGISIEGDAAFLGDISFYKLDGDNQPLRNPDTGEEIVDDTKSVTFTGTAGKDLVVLNGKIRGKNTVKVNLKEGDDTLVIGSNAQGDKEKDGITHINAASVDFGKGDADTHWTLSGSSIGIDFPAEKPDLIRTDSEFNYLAQ